MERGYRRRRAVHRAPSRRGDTSGAGDSATRRRIVKLAACGIIFALAAFIKLLFPGFAGDIGQKLTAAVDYKAALAALGEGISGDKNFTAAIGEAITYAFRGTPTDDDAHTTDGKSDAGDAADASGEAVTDAFAEDSTDIPEWDAASEAPPTPPPDDTAASTDDSQNELASAIISAFLQTQEGYSDYDLPAGTTYDMPVIGAACNAPVTGNITSPFGYRTHPVDGSVKFHYGIDLAAVQGTPVTAFASGDVLAVGESTTLGTYVIITHDGFETLYAHCDEAYISSGQAVTMGDVIASVGDTGNATSYCLHFELKVGGVFVNPAYYLQSV